MFISSWYSCHVSWKGLREGRLTAAARGWLWTCMKFVYSWTSRMEHFVVFSRKLFHPFSCDRKEKIIWIIFVTRKCQKSNKKKNSFFKTKLFTCGRLLFLLAVPIYDKVNFIHFHHTCCHHLHIITFTCMTFRY